MCRADLCQRGDRQRSTVAGGSYNTATSQYSCITGGYGGEISGDYASILGGATNDANGDYATALGGYTNSARTDYSIVAGYRAKSRHPEGIVIAAYHFDIAGDSTWSGADGQIVLEAHGNFCFTDEAGQAPAASSKLINTSTGAYMSTGGTWTNGSDRHLKENFTELATDDLLSRIARLPITRWNYKAEDNDITHIGPVAQDFHALFGVGNDDKSISTLDASGIALAGIQELHKQNEALAAENARLRSDLGDLRRLIEELASQR
jgi:hypothetical protein